MTNLAAPLRRTTQALTSSANTRSRKLLAVATASLVATGALFLASAASADEIQVQSYQRSGESEVCAAQPNETPWQASWGDDSSWHPSWEQWANNGEGGWTCTRSIVWAKSPAAAQAPSVSTAGCTTLYGFDPDKSLDFLGGNFLPAGTFAFTDGTCTTQWNAMTFPMVYAGSLAAASAVCAANVPLTPTAVSPYWAHLNIYYCS